MTVDTKGYIRTPVKNVMHVMTIVEKTIRKMIRAKLPIGPRALYMPEGFAYPDTRLSPDIGMAQTTFSIGGERRTLTVHFGCDCDAEVRYPGKKLILSLGCYGLSEEVITEVLSNLTHLGRCYFDRSDCDDEPDVEIMTAPMTFIEAVVRGYDISANLNHWLTNYKVIGIPYPVEEYLGITSEELASCLEDSAAVYAICDAYKDAAKAALSQATVPGIANA